VAGRKAFLLRLDPALYDAVQLWAADELRSVNGQLEFVIRRALRDAGRLPRRVGAADVTPEPGEPGTPARGKPG
jgi:hypothetical protein